MTLIFHFNRKEKILKNESYERKKQSIEKIEKKNVSKNNVILKKRNTEKANGKTLDLEMTKLEQKQRRKCLEMSSRLLTRSQCDQIGWFIFCILGNFLNPVATIILPKLPTFLRNFCKHVKMFNFASEIIFGNFYSHLATFYWSHC